MAAEPVYALRAWSTGHNRYRWRVSLGRDILAEQEVVCGSAQAAAAMGGAWARELGFQLASVEVTERAAGT